MSVSVWMMENIEKLKFIILPDGKRCLLVILKDANFWILVSEFIQWTDKC